MAGPVAAAVVSRRASDRLRAGHGWVYRSDIEQLLPPAGEVRTDQDQAGAATQDQAGAGIEPHKTELATGVNSADELSPGTLATVLDNRGIPLGTALYSSASQIALRMISTEAMLGRDGFLTLIRERVAAALAYRDGLLADAAGATDACRLIFSEADGLPGVIVDRYAGLVILQLLTQGMAAEDVRAAVLHELRRHAERHQHDSLRPHFDSAAARSLTIWERPDARIREIEQLPAPAPGPLFASNHSPESIAIFKLNGLGFHYDVNSGQKTGAFLDQRENYAAAARHTAAGLAAGGLGATGGDALDICTNQGGFALHLARVCRRVTGVDASRAALEVAERNLELNSAQLIDAGAGVDWIEANAFELLRDYEATGHRFDAIVLDPPAFAKSKRAAEGALRGYKEMNLRALKMLRPGGTLITCSCSHHVSLEEFTGVVAAAASDAHRTVRLLETRGASLDHPAILTLPETSYLKCLICRAV